MAETLQPAQGIRVKQNKTYVFDPNYIDAQVGKSEEWATKTDGKVKESDVEIDYSSKAYAIGGVGTETNNAKYYKEQASLSAASAASDAATAYAAATNVNVVTVGTDLQDANSKIKAVANNKTNIDTVASIPGSIYIVAGIASSVTAVESISSDVSNVASIKTDVSNVSGISSDVSNVSTNISDVGTVSTNISNVNAVGSNINNVNAVAGNATNINAVNANKTNIDTVASNISNVRTVAGISSSVTAVAGNETNINAVNSNKTNIDTVATNISSVNTVSSNISKVNTAATNIQAIIDAPTYAGLAKDWATKTNETVDGSEYSAKHYAEQAAATLNNKIDKDHAVNDFATNCITEIPQDIKLTLSDGTITLKSGSVLTYADGSQYQTTEDKTFAQGGSSSYQGLLIVAKTGTIQGVFAFNKTDSGTTAQRPAWSSSIIGTAYFNTETQKMNLAGGTQWNDDWGVALPVAVCTVTSGVITSIDQVFNGAGYIGSSALVLPGVKFLAPNGFNDDGTLKVTPQTRTALSVVNVNNLNNYSGYGAITYSGCDIGAYNGYNYNPDKNCVMKSTNEYFGNRAIGVYTKVESRRVSEFYMLPASGLSCNYIMDSLKNISGYNGSATQTLKHVNGVLTWVTDT